MHAAGMKPFPLGHPLERCHFKGPATPAVPPPPAMAQQGSTQRDAADAARRKAKNATGVQSTIIGGSLGGGTGGYGSGQKTILGG